MGGLELGKHSEDEIIQLCRGQIDSAYDWMQNQKWTSDHLEIVGRFRQGIAGMQYDQRPTYTGATLPEAAGYGVRIGAYLPDNQLRMLYVSGNVHDGTSKILMLFTDPHVHPTSLTIPPDAMEHMTNSEYAPRATFHEVGDGRISMVQKKKTSRTAYILYLSALPILWSKTSWSFVWLGTQDESEHHNLALS